MRLFEAEQRIVCVGVRVTSGFSAPSGYAGRRPRHEASSAARVAAECRLGSVTGGWRYRLTVRSRYTAARSS